jgi:hypothetical protein
MGESGKLLARMRLQSLRGDAARDVITGDDGLVADDRCELGSSAEAASECYRFPRGTAFAQRAGGLIEARVPDGSLELRAGPQASASLRRLDVAGAPRIAAERAAAGLLFAPLAAGRYRLTCYDPARGQGTLELTLGAGEARELDAPPPVDAAVQLQGRLLSAQGQLPITGAQLELTLDEAGHTLTATSDARGRYRFARVPAGAHELVVTAPRVRHSQRVRVDARGGVHLGDLILAQHARE